MNTLYVIVILFINSTQGNKPMTLEECTKVLVERGPVKAEDVAQVGVCKRYDEGKKT